MTYPTLKDTLITIRAGLGDGSAQKEWAEIAFIYIGCKHKAVLARIHGELERDGVSSWEGFALFHPGHKDA